MNRTGVWISGIGALSSAGADVPGTLKSFREGRRNHSRPLAFDTTISNPTFQVEELLIYPKGRHENDRTLRLTMTAVHEALVDAGFVDGELGGIPAGARVGVCLGTTVACQLNSIAFYAAFRRKENPPLDRVYDFLNANLAQAVAREIGAAGPRMTVVNACSSGADAIGVASSWIRAGLCDVAIAGGADEMYQVPLSGFCSLGVMSSEPCAPFDRDRGGLNLGEGAGVVVLESEAFARSRGKVHRFAVAGYGSACDAYHLTAPHPEGRGLESAIRAALAQAEIGPEQIAFINAHGTATLDNDRTESKTLERVFGEGVKFLSTKGYTGHTLGAAGGLEAVFALLGLRERFIPACAGFVNRMDEAGISPVKELTEIRGEYAMSTSLAFGGNNAAVIIRRVA
jgi:3-oxoacyl-(acyl-carrier-protein) synthase